MLSVSLTPVLQESLLRLSKCLRVAGEEAGKGPIHPSLEGLKCEDTCLAVFPSILTVFQRLLPNPGYQGRSGKLQGGVVTPGGCFPSHTLWLPAVSRSGNQGSRSGCSSRDRGTSSDELPRDVLPGLKSPSSRLKAPFGWAGGVFTAPSPVPIIIHLQGAVTQSRTACAAHGVHWLPRRAKPTREGTGCLVSTLCDVGALPAFTKRPEPKATGYLGENRLVPSFES